MFDIPGFNPSAMSDEELMNRQVELSRRFGWANRFSSSTDMASQLSAMMTAIDMERRDRALRSLFNERNKMFPEIIETEPDLAEQHKRKVIEQDNDNAMINRRKVGRDRLTLTKTPTPTTQQPHQPPKDK